MFSRRLIVPVVSFALASLLATSTFAQDDAKDYPNRSIKIIVPFPAGGPSDVLARIIAQKMTEDWNQPVVVENRVGANTVIGAQAVAKSPADGYTLLMAIDSTLVMNQYLYKSLPYDPINDFTPISVVAKTMQLLIVNASSDIKSVKDLIAKQKANPGKLNYGAGTITTQLTGFLFNKAAGTEAQLVRYNGSAQVAQGLLTQSVDYVVDGTSAALPLIQDGKFRALAKFDSRPFAPVPDLPLIGPASGLSGLDEVTVWLGLVAPKGTSPAIVDKLHKEIVRVLADPGVKAKADAAGLFPAATSPADFASFIRQESARWSKTVAESGIKYD